MVFGAVGNGVADDTAAFEAAISAMPPQSTLLVPRGTYVITRRLDIDKRVFLQGEGAGQTVLFFPKSLTEIYGNTYTGGVSQYAFGPGFINFNGADFPSANTLLAKVTARAGRRATVLAVDKLDNMQPGQVVRVVMDNPNNALLRSLNEGMFPPFEPYNNRQDVIRWTSRIKSILRNPNRIELERSLPFEVDTAWQPEVHDWNNEQYGVKRNFTGVADMTIRFPAGAKFAGEGKELGYNGLYFYGTAHSWVRNVVFENAEFGVAFDSGSFNTVENVTFRSNRPTDATMPYTGGRGIWNKGTFDNLVNWFYFETSMLYEISTSYFAVGNVYANGKGTDPTLELMYGAAYGNLFTNIHLGLGSKPFGWVTRGQDAAGFNTFWNIRTANDKLALPPATWAPRVLFVNAEGAAAPVNASNVGWYVESRPDAFPWDLYGAMARARGRPLPTPVPTRFTGPGYGCLPDGTKCCRSATTGCPLCPANAGDPSVLWGCNGELWSPQGRLAYDWGWAGYANGDRNPPLLPVRVNLKTQFGAKGDGVTDDTQALLKAIDSISSGVIYLPAGTYILTAVINIRKQIVIRGDGQDKTILRFPKSLTDLYGNTYVEGSWVGTSQYSHGTGFINIGGWDPTGRDFTKLTWVTANASRGDRVLRVANSSAISVGQWYRVLQKDPGDGSLMWELNGGAFPVVEAQKGYADPCRFLSRVVAKGADWIWLERPLPFKVDTRWAPEIHKFMPMLNDATGFEYFTLDFPWSPYPGHFLERGFNGLHLNQVVNGWVRGVTVRNSDMGVYTWGSVFTTISGLTLTNSKPRAWYNGHRGLWMEHGSDSMVTNFNITDRFVHDISVTGTEHGTVIMNGAGFDINLDHHRMAPYQNLFTNIDVGLGSRVFYASGDANWGPHAGVFSTFHNLQSDMRFLLPSDDDFGANLTFIGLPSDDPRDPPGLGWHVELLARPFPANLYTSFTNTRAARNLGAGVCAPLSIC
ncbi:hypothetical protein OEZ86_011499 [Tetradesmus obliquus]|nr:hypothetical protein OEZ86_011499 [Tetradesmus obliquus]